MSEYNTNSYYNKYYNDIMGIKSFKDISLGITDRTGTTQIQNEKIANYHNLRSQEGRYTVIVDSSYKSISSINSRDKKNLFRNSFPMNKMTTTRGSIDELMLHLYDIGCLSNSYHKSGHGIRSYVYVHDPTNKLDSTAKINRVNHKYDERLFNDVSYREVKCIGNMYDFMISYYFRQSKLSSIQTHSIATGDFPKTADELSDLHVINNRNGYNIPFPDISKFRTNNVKRTRLDMDKLELIFYLEKIMNPLYFITMIKNLKNSCMIGESALPYIKKIRPQTCIASINVNRFTDDYLPNLNGKLDDTISKLNPSIFDIYNIKKIMSMDYSNIISYIVEEFLIEHIDTFESLYDGNVSKFLDVYCEGIEADWIIIALTHILIHTKIYTKDTDILILGSSDTYSITSNPMVMLRLMEMMDVTTMTPADLKIIICGLFLTGSDYMKMDMFGSKTYIGVIIDRFIRNDNVNVRSSIDVNDIKYAYDRYIHRGIHNKYSSYLFLDNAIDVYVRIMEFYWE